MVRYMPQNSQARMTLGMLDYLTGDKPAALEDLRKAKTADEANFKRRFDQIAQRPAYKPVLEDKEFLKSLFPE